MKIVVTGSRDWYGGECILDAFEAVCRDFNINPPDIILINGDARGLDTQAAQLGTLLGMDVRDYPAHWKHSWDYRGTYCPYECIKGCKEMVGRPAGVIRNQKMLTDNPDIELALSFHPDLENSKGTGDMCRRVDKAGIPRRHFTGPTFPHPDNK